MNLFAFGLGYSARAFIARYRPDAWAGTVRRPSEGSDAMAFDAGGYDPALPRRLQEADTLLVSIAPDAAGDPTLRAFGAELGRSGKLKDVVYLSTIGVYGDAGGGWIDETALRAAVSPRGHWRVRAEDSWLELAEVAGWRLHILRLAGIYGPGRSVLDKVARGEARRIVKPGQVFNRIHVADIARLIERAVAAKGPGLILNAADDEPAPPQDVIAYAAALLGLPPPPEEEFATADMTPMARSFYADNKRISTMLAKQAVGFAPAFPTYREGLRALAAERGG